MSRVVFCLLYFAILQYAIHANETTTDGTLKSSEPADKVTKEDLAEDKTAKEEPADDKKAKEKSAEDKTAKEEPAVEKKSAISDDDKEAESKTAEATKEDATEDSSTKTTPEPTSSSKPLNFAGKIISPVMAARAKIEEIVQRSVDGAKGIADGTYNFFKDSVPKLF